MSGPTAVMGPPIVWPASAAATGAHDERIVATEFDGWLRERTANSGADRVRGRTGTG
jgi:hypothetical protein